MRSLFVSAFFAYFSPFIVLGFEASNDKKVIENQNEWKELLSQFRTNTKLEKNKSSEYVKTAKELAFQYNQSISAEPLWTSLLSDDGFEDELNVGKSLNGASLAFVFDSTGSMRKELDQIKAGAKTILATLRSLPEAPIINYIWVPFNDPGPITVTRNHRLFEDKMNEVMAMGGGDCPEVSMGAINKALEVSLPHSYIYVFTDAPAKDHNITNGILSLVQQKKTQVVFILTEGCINTTTVDYKVYEKVAETSSGQIYWLKKTEVKDVLKYVEGALQPNVVSLISLKKPAPSNTTPDNVQVVVDDSLKQFTISVSGKNAEINVGDPNGTPVTGPPKLEMVLNLTNIQVVNVNEPNPGIWSVNIKSDSDYTLKSTGLSRLNFIHGFSTKKTFNIKETSNRPLKGSKSHILIQTSDNEHVSNIKSLEFVGLSGEIFQEIQLKPVEEKDGLYVGETYTPTNDFFYLRVNGFDRDGFPIKRITSTAISSQLPEKPLVTMKSRAVAEINTVGLLKCHVESLVPTIVKWYKNGKDLGRDQNCSETCESTFVIDKITSQSEGEYVCGASNVAGSNQKILKLIVTGDVPYVKVNPSVVASVGQRVFLKCSVFSKIPVTVMWAQFTVRNSHSGTVHPSSIGVKLDDNTLMIESVKAEDEGWYICIAKNHAGESQGRVLLVIKQPLEVKVEPKTLNFVKGDFVRINCSVSGKPRPHIEWNKNQLPIKDPSVIFEEINENLNLVIDYLDERHAGTYSCNAINERESASSSITLTYWESPTVKAKENNLIVKSNTDVFMKCIATGQPKPVIKWFANGKNLNGTKYQIGVNSLIIKASNVSDSGEYSCKAENDAGVASDHIGLTVGSAPSFLQNPRDKSIHLNHTGTIPCPAYGVPLPEIKWKRTEGRNIDPSRMSILPTGSLKINRAVYEDEGKYVCVAENVFGSTSYEVMLSITGVEKPNVDNGLNETEVKAVSGGTVIIPCGILLGNPPAKVKWYRDNLELDISDTILIKPSGHLVIKNVKGGDRGIYKCIAENAVGNSSREHNVLVSESPKVIDEKENDLKKKVGGEAIITCPIEGYPLPMVTWTKDGSPLPMSSTIFQDENGSLIIKNLTEKNGGTYMCTASNPLGSASKKTSLQVQVVPLFTDDVQDLPINVVEGNMVVLNCNATGIPEPTFQWYKDGLPYMKNIDQPQILRFLAKVDHTGIYKCVVSNEAGSNSRKFEVTILVSPKILGRPSEETIKARAGAPTTLICNVIGSPPPTILWQRNGMYFTQNTTEVTVSDSGLLTIKNVTKESAGAYICDAENLGGITQKIYYLQVNYPPLILKENNYTKSIILGLGEEYSLGCTAEGNPIPRIVWKKNGLPIHKHQNVTDGNTLLFLKVDEETKGLYRCEAVNSEGLAFKEYEISIAVPSLISDFYPTKLEVNEGDSFTLTCPTLLSTPPSKIQWLKNDKPIALLLKERSDDARIKLSLDQRTITILEAHPSDKGDYSCVATTLAGRTDAKFFVDILMTPHFEEFNHVAHRTILTGGEVVLNCSVSGNPLPKISWRKENTSLSPHETPGIQVTMDGHLTIVNGRVSHSGTYICLATNKVNTKEREFYVTVLEPPQMLKSLKETIQVMKGDNLTLDCKSLGTPSPTFSWTKKNDTKTKLNYSGNVLTIFNVGCNDSGTYLCETTNSVGTRTKYFEVNVLESPKIENQEEIDEINGIVGGNVTMKCKTSGYPKPDTMWLHNGHILNRRKRSIQVTEDHVSLSLSNIDEKDKGIYALLAFNKAGVVEKKFKIQVIVPPSLWQGKKGKSESLAVKKSLPVVLKCPVKGDPAPMIAWLKGDDSKNIDSNENVVVFGNEILIKKPTREHSGVYVCLAENAGGQLAYSFNVSVVEQPKVNGNLNNFYNVKVNDSLTLYCNITDEQNIKYSWNHSSQPIINSSDTVITDGGKTLQISKLKGRHSGLYECKARNDAGQVSVFYHIKVNDSKEKTYRTMKHKVAKINQTLILKCPFKGDLPVDVTWYRNNRIIQNNHTENSVMLQKLFLKIPVFKAKDVGNYACEIKNEDERYETNFEVEVLVPGKWSQWSSWSPCSVSCGSGEQFRKRSCNLDNDINLPLNKSRIICKGQNRNRRLCVNKCRINRSWESWGSWGEWSSCTKSCGVGGVRRRFRICGDSKIKNRAKNCKGSNRDEEACNERGCPVDGHWSEWSAWSGCSQSCGGGEMKRTRKCNSPRPQYGGKPCIGLENEIILCGVMKCEESGDWLPWSQWSSCSQTCGKGYRKRIRKCNETNETNQCKGENLQIKNCFRQKCFRKAFPSSADLRIKGNLNGKTIDKQIYVKIEDLQNKRKISTNATNFLSGDKWFPYSNFLLSPLSWNTAYETDDANNGYSLTDGNFFSQSDIKFSSGEELKVKHKGEGVQKNRTFVVEIEVTGEVPQVEPHAVVLIDPIQQDFIQAGPNKLYSFTENNVTVEGRSLPYFWNNSIHYSALKGTMPYLVERLTLRDISNTYDSHSQNIIYSASSSIAKTFDKNQCPPGFFHNKHFMHCEGTRPTNINECEMELSICGQNELCDNSFGSYNCICRKGYKLSQGMCIDIDECSQDYSACSHYCHNIPGSYMCSCPYGFYLNNDRKTCIDMAKELDLVSDVNFLKNASIMDYFDNESEKYQEHTVVKKSVCPPGYFMKNDKCNDYDECKAFPNICDVEEICVNLPGFFQCISTPCPAGYERNQTENSCFKMCSPDHKCLKGALISESLLYYSATLNLKNILSLDKIIQPQNIILKTKFKVTQPRKIFQVIVTDGRSYLYPMRQLNSKTLYRVKVEAFSYDKRNTLLYFTDIVIYLVIS